MQQRHDVAVIVHADVQLPPAAALVRLPVLARTPFAGAVDLQPGRVDDQVDRAVVSSAQGGDQHVPVAPGQRRVVRGVQVQAHQPEQRRDEALGLPKRQVEEHAQGQRRQDRQVRVALLPATTPGRRRGPRTESVLGEPDGDIASGAQPALVRRPVPDPIPLLVLGVHPAGFRRGHGFAPSTAWYAGARDPGYSCTNPPERAVGTVRHSRNRMRRLAAHPPPQELSKRVLSLPHEDVVDGGGNRPVEFLTHVAVDRRAAGDDLDVGTGFLWGLYTKVTIRDFVRSIFEARRKTGRGTVKMKIG